jgi:CheY-like chemotaxis protein
MPETKASLLIVDDELSIRTTLSNALTEIGYSVRTAGDGFSALAELRQAIPDVLLSDLNMPGMSGYELLSVVRHRFPAIRTVAMSGAFCGDEVPSGVAADAFYQKGSSLGSLLRIVEALPQTERHGFQPCRAPAPLWIHRYGNDWQGKAPVTMTCPECFRTSSQALEGFGSLMREVICAHCGQSIEQAIAEPSEQPMAQPFQHRAPAANLAQNASKLSN